MADDDLGDVLRDLENEKKARAISLKNDGNTFYRQGFFDEALNCYNEALSIDPDNPDLLNNKGLALVKLGRIDEAKEVDMKRTGTINKSLHQPDVNEPLSPPVIPPPVEDTPPVFQAPPADPGKNNKDINQGNQNQKDPCSQQSSRFYGPGWGRPTTASTGKGCYSSSSR